MTQEHDIIVRHLRKSRDIGKHVLKVVTETGSVIIKHKFIVTTFVSEKIVMESTICFLPLTRMYKKGKDKIVDDENLLNEDIEKWL